MEDQIPSTAKAREAIADLADLVDGLPSEAPGLPPPKRKRKRRRLLGIVAGLLVLAVVILLPFIVFVRVSVFAYVGWGLSTWPALGAGMLATVFLLTAYGATISKKLTGRARVRLLAKRVALPLVICYCGYGLWYLSAMNAKTDDVRSHYTALHPLLRIAVGTIVLVDRDIVLTDVQRTPQDYATMGLPPREQSLHYEQPDGFVHAVDLRTLGRGSFENRLVRLYFRVMGFGTLRHVGTADHLHVSLPTRGDLRLLP